VRPGCPDGEHCRRAGRRDSFEHGRLFAGPDKRASIAAPATRFVVRRTSDNKEVTRAPSAAKDEPGHE
jgi:hypothetical protein